MIETIAAFVILGLLAWAVWLRVYVIGQWQRCHRRARTRIKYPPLSAIASLKTVIGPRVLDPQELSAPESGSGLPVLHLPYNRPGFQRELARLGYKPQGGRRIG